MTDMAEPEWGGKIIWSGSETASGDNVHFGGYLEGAVASSVRTLGLLGPEEPIDSAEILSRYPIR